MEYSVTVVVTNTHSQNGLPAISHVVSSACSKRCTELVEVSLARKQFFNQLVFHRCDTAPAFMDTLVDGAGTQFDTEPQQQEFSNLC